MRPVISPVADGPVNKNFSSLREVLCGSLSIDNMLFQVVAGVTANTADTEAKIQHSMTPRPVAWFPLIGDVYVQGISDKFIDVRATKPGVNFKIIVLGGPSVTGENLQEIGNDSYLDTNAANQAANIPSSVSGLNGISFTVNPGVTTPAINYCSVATDGDYFYLTSTGGTTNELNRISRDDGSITSLALGTIPLGCIKVVPSEGSVYVCARAADTGGTGSISIFQVSLATFTLTATHTATNTGSAVSPIMDFTYNTTHFFIPTTTSTGNSRIHKFTKGGGIASITTLGVGTKAGRGIVLASDGLLYVTETDTSVALSRIYAVNPTTLAVATTISTANRRYRLGKIMEHEGFLLAPAFTDTAKSITSQSIKHGFALLGIELATYAISEYGVPAMHTGASSLQCFAGNMVLQPPYLYLINSSTVQGSSVIRANLDDGTFNIQWYPIFSTASNDAWDTCLIPDVSGEPLVLYSPGSADLDGFFWTPPVFVAGVDSLFLLE